MKKYFLGMTGMLMAVILFSCEDNRGQLMVPDKVYLVKTGLYIEESFDMGEKVVTELWANKSGLTNTPCTVTFKVDTEALDLYNVENGSSYEILPTSCYSIPQSTFTISGNEQYAKLRIEYDPAKIVAEVGGIYGDTNFALPLTVSSDGVETTGANTVLLAFTVNEPSVRILTDHFDMLRVFENNEDDKTIERKIDVGMSFVNQWDATVTLESDRSALRTLVDEAKGKVNYIEKRLVSTSSSEKEDFRNVLTHIDAVLPPDDAYTLSEVRSIKTGENKMTVTCTINKSKLYPGLNIIPIKITDVSDPLKIDPTHTVCYIPIQYVPDRSKTLIKSTSSHQALNYSPKRIAGIFDGDFDTSWRPGVGTASFPPKGNDQNPTIVVDLGTETDVTAVEIWTRGPNERQGSRNETYRASPSYIKNVKVYVASDTQCWDGTDEFLNGTYVNGSNMYYDPKPFWGDCRIDYNWTVENAKSAPCTLTLPVPVKGRYVIVWYTKDANQADIWELFVYGKRM